jgi:hypothetical protein
MKRREFIGGAVRAHIKNETPKKARGDKRQE